MKQTVGRGALAATWDSQALYDKAARYMQQVEGLDSDEWDYALWSSLALELLARAALANVHPALLAEPDKNGSNLVSALGFEPIEKKFSPKSITVAEVFRRLAAMLPDFAAEHESFGIQHTGRRNAELHSGEIGFDGVKGSSWQPRFYQTCSVLLASMGVTLEEFVGADEAKAAEAIMAAAADESAKVVKGDVEAHSKVWQAKGTDERATLTAQAQVWATRQAGHRVGCPACGSQALVVGGPVTAPARKLEGDEIVEKQEYLPNHFECIACGLKMTGLSRLAVVGLAGRYIKTQVYDAAEYYAPPEDEYAGYEEDNNER
ncbi:hypothetical protein [Sphingobium aquiterrae]|uniref:hypothetical protein n=1 Tax=Sphingobium aquiterrae TaxID=2038656 RepID=UPI00301746BF